MNMNTDIKIQTKYINNCLVTLILILCVIPYILRMNEINTEVNAKIEPIVTLLYTVNKIAMMNKTVGNTEALAAMSASLRIFTLSLCRPQ